MSSEQTEGVDDRVIRLRVILIVILVLIALDSFMLLIVVPWANDFHASIYGSLGYAIAFLTFLMSFIVLLALLAYYFNSESYPSDRWQ